MIQKIFYLAITALVIALVAVNLFVKDRKLTYRIDAALVLVPLILRLLLLK